MSCCVLCLTTSGVPLFIRNKNHSNFFSLPFSLIGSLSGAHIFAAHHETALLSTATKTSNIVWKVFHNSITMIALSSDASHTDVHLYRLLENIFQCLVLLIGLDDLINIKNVERLKRELKCTYNMMTCLLEENEFLGDLCGSVDVMLCTEADTLQHALDSFLEQADSTYGCLLVHTKVCVATKKWWSLTGQELLLISLLIHTLPRVSSRDIPVFLPRGSPTVAHRLITFQLMQGVEVCMLCGPTPTLAQIQSQVINYWRPVYDTLRSALGTHPRNFPHDLAVDGNILGFLVVNTEMSRCVYTVQPRDSDSRKEGSSIGSSKRKHLLRSYYKSVVGRLFHPQLYPYKPPDPTDEMSRRMKHYVLETYMCCSDYKYYAMQTSQHQIFVLFNTNIPTFAMRMITKKTLDRLTTAKLSHI